MDVFCEYMVKRKRDTRAIMLCALSIMAAITLTLFVLAFLFGRLLGLEVFIIAAVWFGAGKMIGTTDIEYEYILTNSVMDVDKIMAKKTRKRIASIDFKEIEACAPAEDAPVAEGLKVLDLTGDAQRGRVYYVDFFKSSQKTRVYFQPSAKILNNIKAVNPRLITVKDEDLV